MKHQNNRESYARDLQEDIVDYVNKLKQQMQDEINSTYQRINSDVETKLINIQIESDTKNIEKKYGLLFNEVVRVGKTVEQQESRYNQLTSYIESKLKSTEYKISPHKEDIQMYDQINTRTTKLINELHHQLNNRISEIEEQVRAQHSTQSTRSLLPEYAINDQSKQELLTHIERRIKEVNAKLETSQQQLNSITSQLSSNISKIEEKIQNQLEGQISTTNENISKQDYTYREQQSKRDREIKAITTNYDSNIKNIQSNVNQEIAQIQQVLNEKPSMQIIKQIMEEITQIKKHFEPTTQRITQMIVSEADSRILSEKETQSIFNKIIDEFNTIIEQVKQESNHNITLLKEQIRQTTEQIATSEKNTHSMIEKEAKNQIDYADQQINMLRDSTAKLNEQIKATIIRNEDNRKKVEDKIYIFCKTLTIKQTNLSDRIKYINISNACQDSISDMINTIESNKNQEMHTALSNGIATIRRDVIECNKVANETKRKLTKLEDDHKNHKTATEKSINDIKTKAIQLQEKQEKRAQEIEDSLKLHIKTTEANKTSNDEKMSNMLIGIQSNKEGVEKTTNSINNYIQHNNAYREEQESIRKQESKAQEEINSTLREQHSQYANSNDKAVGNIQAMHAQYTSNNDKAIASIKEQITEQKSNQQKSQQALADSINTQIEQTNKRHADYESSNNAALTKISETIKTNNENIESQLNAYKQKKEEADKEKDTQYHALMLTQSNNLNEYTQNNDSAIGKIKEEITHNKENIEAQLNKHKTEQENNSKAHSDAVNSIIENNNATQNNQISNCREEIKNTNKEIENTEKQITQLQNTLETNIKAMNEDANKKIQNIIQSNSQYSTTNEENIKSIKENISKNHKDIQTTMEENKAKQDANMKEHIDATNKSVEDINSTHKKYEEDNQTSIGGINDQIKQTKITLEKQINELKAQQEDSSKSQNEIHSKQMQEIISKHSEDSKTINASVESIKEEMKQTKITTEKQNTESRVQYDGKIKTLSDDITKQLLDYGNNQSEINKKANSTFDSINGEIKQNKESIEKQHTELKKQLEAMIQSQAEGNNKQIQEISNNINEYGKKTSTSIENINEEIKQHRIANEKQFTEYGIQLEGSIKTQIEAVNKQIQDANTAQTETVKQIKESIRNTETQIAEHKAQQEENIKLQSAATIKEIQQINTSQTESITKINTAIETIREEIKQNIVASEKQLLDYKTTQEGSSKIQYDTLVKQLQDVNSTVSEQYKQTSQSIDAHKENYNSSQKEIQASIGAITKQMEAMQGTHSEYSTKNDALVANIKSLIESTASDINSKFTTQIDNFKSTYDEAQKENDSKFTRLHSELDAFKQNTEKQISEHRSSIANDVNSKIEKVLDEAKSAKENNTTVQKSNEQLLANIAKEINTIKEANTTEATNAKASTDTLKTEITAKIEQITKSAAEQENKLKDASALILEVKANVLAEIKNINTELYTEIVNVKTNSDKAFEDTGASNKNTFQNIHTRLSTLENSTAKSSTDLETSLGNTQKQLTDTISSHEKLINEIKQSIEAANKDSKHAEETVTAQINNCTSLVQGNHKKLEAALDSANNELIQFKQTTSDTTATMSSSINQNKQSFEKAIEQIKTEFASNYKDVASKCDSLLELKTLNEQLKNTTAALSTEINTVKESVKTANSSLIELPKLQNNLDEQMKKIIKYDDEFELTKGTEKAMRSELDSLSKNILTNIETINDSIAKIKEEQATHKKLLSETIKK